jgi:hypothetical protein
MTRNIRLLGIIVLMIVEFGVLILVLILSTQSPDINSFNIRRTATWMSQWMKGGTIAGSRTPRPITIALISPTEINSQPFKPARQ